MPLYTYDCEDGHTCDRRGGYDDADVECFMPMVVEGQHEVVFCTKTARRRAVYPSQGVIFRGDGFTRSVIPPPRPMPESTAKLTTDERMEVLDQMAKDTFEYDRNVLPYEKEMQKGKEVRS